MPAARVNCSSAAQAASVLRNAAVRNSGGPPFLRRTPAPYAGRAGYGTARPVESMLAEMRTLYERGHTPKATPSKGCSACSLKEVCLPRLIKTPAASAYLQAHLSDAEETI